MEAIQIHVLVSNLKGVMLKFTVDYFSTLFIQVCRLSNSKSWKSSGNGSRRKSTLITGYYCSYFEKFINLQTHVYNFRHSLSDRHLILWTHVLLRLTSWQVVYDILGLIYIVWMPFYVYLAKINGRIIGVNYFNVKWDLYFVISLCYCCKVYTSVLLF